MIAWLGTRALRTQLSPKGAVLFPGRTVPPLLAMSQSELLHRCKVKANAGQHETGIIDAGSDYVGAVNGPLVGYRLFARMPA